MWAGSESHEVLPSLFPEPYSWWVHIYPACTVQRIGDSIVFVFGIFVFLLPLILIPSLANPAHDQKDETGGN